MQKRVGGEGGGVVTRGGNLIKRITLPVLHFEGRKPLNLGFVYRVWRPKDSDRMVNPDGS